MSVITTTRPLRIGRLSTTAALYLQASIIVALLAGSSAPTPLYAVYQAEWGFSPITTTVIFGIYAIAVLAALLTVGSLSDHIGRRPVLLAALAVQAPVMLVFATAHGVPELMFARIAQGLSTGAAIGAVGAGMLDLDRVKGTTLNAVAPMTGTATGALLSGLFIEFLPAPTHVVYVVLFAAFIAQGIGVLLMRESSSPRPGAVASLQIQFGMPENVRRHVLVAIPALVAVWSLAGFYGSLGPTLVRLLSGSDSFVLAGLSMFALAGSAAVTVLFLRNTEPRRLMLAGMLALIVGVGITLVAISLSSTIVLFAGGIVAGAGFGGGFQGSIRTVVPLVAPHERAGVLSLMYVVSYLAMGLPAVIAGFLVVDVGGVLTTAREYGVAVMTLAAVAAMGLALTRQGSKNGQIPTNSGQPVTVGPLAAERVSVRA
ncbi:MAG: transporter [Aeromicrobium sp.]|nr:transporter [Aeromicrobium sp.]